MSDEYVPRFGLYPTAPRAVEQALEKAIDAFVDQFGHMIAAGATMGEAWREGIRETLGPTLDAHAAFGAKEAATRLAVFEEILKRWGVPDRDFESALDPWEIG